MTGVFRYVALRDRSNCKHETVMPDPITGDWVCPKCFKDFRQIPEVDVELPRGSMLWQRIKWAFKPVRKVTPVAFVWTVEWGNLRHREDHVPNVEPKTWRRPRVRRHFSDAEIAKVYDHPSSRNEP